MVAPANAIWNAKRRALLPGATMTWSAFYFDLQLSRVKVCDGLAEFGDSCTGQVAMAGGVFNQRTDDFGMGRKAGLAKS